MIQHIPITSILFPDPVAAGMNPYELLRFAQRYRNTNEDRKPIVLEPEGSYYRIVDGRHRVVASMMAGRKTVLADVRVA